MEKLKDKVRERESKKYETQQQKLFYKIEANKKLRTSKRREKGTIVYSSAILAYNIDPFNETEVNQKQNKTTKWNGGTTANKMCATNRCFVCFCFENMHRLTLSIC